MVPFSRKELLELERAEVDVVVEADKTATVPKDTPAARPAVAG